MRVPEREYVTSFCLGNSLSQSLKTLNDLLKIATDYQEYERVDVVDAKGAPATVTKVKAFIKYPDIKKKEFGKMVNAITILTGKDYLTYYYFDEIEETIKLIKMNN